MDEAQAERCLKMGARGWLVDINEEVERAGAMYPPASTLHEGWALIQEEVDELWDLVKQRRGHGHVPRGCTEEAIQIAAMAVWFLMSFGGKEV